MKPAWDKLMKNFNKEGAAGVVADVDCTAAGKELCNANGVRGYPTIKYGDPSDLQDYKGGRDYDALMKFAEENLGPSCGPANLDLCDDDKKAKIEEYLELSVDDLEAKVKEGSEALKTADKTFEDAVEELQNTYKQLMEDKENTIKEINDSGLGLYKSVLAHKKKNKDEL